MDYNKKSIALHKKLGGKLEVAPKVSLKNKDDLSLAYTPGVAAVCTEIAKNPKKVWELTSMRKTVAVVSDGSAVLGLGDIGPQAALPVMEGKCALFKQFGGVDAIPLVLGTQDPKEIIHIVKRVAPNFGGINLEDISAPRCFEIEEVLDKELHIPVFHDDQHGTAIVVLAGLINALKITKKSKSAKIVINGAGAAGVAIVKLLHSYGMKNMLVCDSKGIVSKSRKDLNPVKKSLLSITNSRNLNGSLEHALKGSDIFIGVSKANLLNASHIKSMNKDAIIFAMANPIPEIMPDIAKKAGAKVVATGRSDFANQINNSLVFPGLFRGLLDKKITKVTMKTKLRAADALAKLVKKPTPSKIIPTQFEKGVAKAIANSVK